ncbi:sensor histidine kinase [Pseudonocardia sp. CA-107938]|uniref:sensor histidine kinase n=1 Tax=Pseudonocardia sp. CA-107938 TaxID=3240021 RepID=UPI003D92B109
MRVWSAISAGEPEFGWLGRLIGTAVVVGSLVTARVPADAVWVWLLLGGAAACWAAFVVLDHRVPRRAATALAVGAIAAAATVAGTTDSAGAAIAFSCLVMVALHPAVPPPATVAVAAVVGLLLVVPSLDRGTERLLVLAAVTVLITLSGLLRRSYHLRATETAQLLEQTRRAQDEHARAAALDERARIARELHDVLAHSLGALGVQLEVAEALLADRRDVPAALERVQRSRRLAADGLVEARAAVAALRRDVLPLPDALGELAAAHARDHLGEPPDLQVVGTPRPVRAAVEVSLAGAAREALTNAARHAPGAPLHVVLEFRPDAVAVAVRNEAARVPAASSVPGHGLTGMRERLALVGGRLTAGPDGAGWAVVAEVPGA